MNRLPAASIVNSSSKIEEPAVAETNMGNTLNIAHL